jgi:hypothetical protein
MLKRMMLVAIVGLCGWLSVYPVSGQTNNLSEVYVTTQDYAALRAGPGQHWERLAVLPYGAIYRATGRTFDGQWLQIAYEGDLEPGARTDFTIDNVTYGWIAYWLLTWTGNVLELPIDGVTTVAIARAAAPIIIVGPDLENIYVGDAGPAARIPNPVTSTVRVEVTGRLGSADAGYFWLQFKYGGEYYWIPTWEAGVPGGYRQLPDAAYLYPYGRLLIQLRTEIARAESILNDIGGRWHALANGQATTCNNIPDDFALFESSFNAYDLSLEPLYQPLTSAVANAQNSINSALERFRQVCTQTDDNRLVSPEEISAALADVENAERNLTLVRTLLIPFEERDPFL